MKIINNIVLKSLIKNKKRTLVSIISVTLASILLFTIGFIFGTYRENRIKNIIDSNGSFDVVYKNVTNTLNNDLIKEYEYNFKVYDAYIDVNNIIIYSMSDNFKINILSGYLPENSNEIIIPISNTINNELKIGDTFTIDLIDMNDKKIQKNYKITGFYQDNIYNNYIDDKFIAYTKEDINNKNMNLYVYLKDKNNAYEKIELISKKLNINNEDDIVINKELLKMYGNFDKNNYYDNLSYLFIVAFLIIVLGVVSIFCMIIIFDSFYISVLERTKDIGVLKSIGATTSQIIKSSFTEIFVIGLISIPLGFIISYFSVKVFIDFINNLLIDSSYTFSFYPLYIIVSLIFIIITLLYSGLFPIIRISKNSPIESIRNNQDIKLNKKRIKNNFKNVSTLISYLNFKRSKKKYSITIFSISISILLFITAATIINFFSKNVTYNINDYDIFLSIPDEYTGDIVKLDEIDDYIYYKSENVLLKFDNKIDYNYDYLKSIDNYNLVNALEENTEHSRIYLFDNETMYEIKNELNIDEDIIVIDYVEIYNENFEISYKGPKFNSFENVKLCSIRYDILSNKNMTDNCLDEKIGYSTYIPKKLRKYNLGQYLIIVNEDIFKSIGKDNINNIIIDTDKYLEIDSKIRNILLNINSIDYTYNNYGLENLKSRRSFTAIKYVIYSLIALFSFISVTNIINKVNTNMSLRKKEFFVLKSIGMDKKIFKKIILKEGFYISIKSLLYGISISLIVIYFLTKTFNNELMGNYSFFDILPISYLIITILIVPIIINVTMLMSIDFKSNMIDEIKKEYV